MRFTSSSSAGRIRLIRSSSLALLALVVILASAAAASAASVRTLHGTLKACAIATMADAKIALGEPVNAGSSSTIDVWSSCSFDGAKNFKIFTFQVASTSMIEKKHRGQTAAGEFSQARAGGHTTQVNGLGQKAFWLARYGELWVLKGDVVSSYTGAPESGGIAAARRILARI